MFLNSPKMMYYAEAYEMSLRQLFLTDNLLSDNAISSQRSASHSSNKIARVLTKYVP